MAKIIPPLTDARLKTAKIKERDYKLFDHGGLVLLVRKSGTKVWQFPYLFMGKRNVATIGRYPLVTLIEARSKREAIKRMLMDGLDPNQQKKIEQNPEIETKTLFETIAREWHSKQLWEKKYSASVLSSLENDVFPRIGNRKIADVTARDVIHILESIEKRGALDVAKRVCQRLWAIFDHAIKKDLIDNNPATGRSGTIQHRQVQHRPYLLETELPDFLKDLESYHGRKMIKLALKLLVLTFVRPGELRNARWNEFDFDNAEWRIPAERMKMKRIHIVPLSSQSLTILNELKITTGKHDLVFPGIKSPDKPISDVTLLKALQIMEYVGGHKKKKIVPHGFRATASTILNERGKFRPDLIERQLAHIEMNKVRAAYNHAEYLDERKDMMQWWGKNIEQLSLVNLV